MTITMTEKELKDLHADFVVKRIGNLGLEFCERINQAEGDAEAATREFCGAICAAYNQGLRDGMHVGEIGKLDYSDNYWNEE